MGALTQEMSGESSIKAVVRATWFQSLRGQDNGILISGRSTVLMHDSRPNNYHSSTAHPTRRSVGKPVGLPPSFAVLLVLS